MLTLWGHCSCEVVKRRAGGHISSFSGGIVETRAKQPRYSTGWRLDVLSSRGCEVVNLMCVCVQAKEQPSTGILHPHQKRQEITWKASSSTAIIHIQFIKLAATTKDVTRSFENISIAKYFSHETIWMQSKSAIYQGYACLTHVFVMVVKAVAQTLEIIRACVRILQSIGFVKLVALSSITQVIQFGNLRRVIQFEKLRRK